MAPLGQNALYAFTAHVAVVALVALVLKPFGLATDSPAWLNALIQVASVLLIWTMAQRHLLESSPRAKLIWRASPAVFALLALAILPWLPMPAADQRSQQAVDRSQRRQHGRAGCATRPADRPPRPAAAYDHARPGGGSRGPPRAGDRLPHRDAGRAAVRDANA